MQKSQLLAGLLLSAGLSMTPAQQPASSEPQHNPDHHSASVCVALTSIQHGSLPVPDLCGCHGGNCRCD